MISKAKINFWTDVVIGLAFVIAAVSGIVLLFAPSGGYQGGRNVHYEQTILLLGHHTWDTLHTWGSIAMIAGVFVHLVLHWKWMVCMTKRLIGRPKKSTSSAEACVT